MSTLAHSRRLAAGALHDGGAARFGRRTVRPHAHPAAPPRNHEGNRSEAVMTELRWAGVSMAEEDKRLSGKVQPGIDISGARGWCDVIAHFVGAPLLAALNGQREPDWAPHAVRVKPSRPRDVATADKVMLALARQKPGPWESERFSNAQADIVRSIWQQLSAGRIRAYGRRAQPGAPWEWIPREAWEQYPGIDHGYGGGPWAALFTNGGNAFRLDDGPAWCDAAVIESPRAGIDWQTHRQAEIERQATQDQQQEATSQNVELQSAEIEQPAAEQTHARQQAPGGRPREYNRGNFDIELQRYRRDNPRGRKRDEIAHMIKWTGRKWPNPPSKSWIRQNAARTRNGEQERG